jgi:hypothetical protein
VGQFAGSIGAGEEMEGLWRTLRGVFDQLAAPTRVVPAGRRREWLAHAGSSAAA